MDSRVFGALGGLGASLIAAASALANGAHTFFDQGGAIPDDNPEGLRRTILLPDISPRDIKGVVVRLDLSYPWVGDVTATLSHVGFQPLTTVGLINRPGHGGPGTSGDGSILEGEYFFNDWTAFPTIAQAAALVGDGELVAPGTYGVDGPGSLQDFRGHWPLGEWTLHLTDGAAGNVGTLRNWSLTLFTVPAPGAWMIVLVGAGWGAGRGRRRGGVANGT